MSREFAISAALLVSAITLLEAQLPPSSPPAPPGFPSQATPPRDARPGENPQKGKAVLRGYVTAADTGTPLRRALVRAMSQDGRNSGMATTDADGRFEIADLLGGRYMLSASKAGYVTMAYGQRRPEQQGTVLEIVDGTVVDRIPFALPRGGVIAGTVLDEFGDPVAGAQVTALRSRYFNGAQRLGPAGSATTDDRGAFRIYGLTPADYYVSAALRMQQQMMAGAIATGAVEGYAPTYYPGTPNAAEASRITVRAGHEASNITLALVAARLAQVTGRAVTSTGAPVAQGFVTVAPADRLDAGAMLNRSSTMTAPDGTFRILGVAPGTYTLMLRPRSMEPGAEFGNARVTVGTENVDNVLLVTAPGGIARGIVTTDENAPSNLRPEQVLVMAQATGTDFLAMMGEGRVKDDWTFELTGLSDTRRLRATVTQNPDWFLKAVVHNGIDITDSPIEFRPGQTVDGFQIVLTRKATELSGQITRERGAPETDATVVIFSEDPERWGMGTRFVRTARPNQEGRYTLRGVPPHDYFVVAVKDMEPGRLQDREFLSSLRPQAVRVSLAENEKKVQDLKVAAP